MDELRLRYGVNPHQKPARAFVRSGRLPIVVRNGAPSYINLLDALNAWQLVRELHAVLGLAAAASFKHVSPAGAAVGAPLDERLRRAYLVDDLELSPLAAAYARSRGADRVASFGDWAALSDRVDLATARVLRREVSDGVVAPGYEDDALELLREKQDGRYVALEIDPAHEPPSLETREVFGVTLEQARNTVVPAREALQNIVTRSTALPDTAARDLLVALVTLKYTQSNSVCLARDGQVIGVGAGQQSRIDCTRLAATKAERWFLRQHPRMLGIAMGGQMKRPERDNAVDEAIRAMDERERGTWLEGLREVALGSDGYFPFRDSIDRAHDSGVRYVVQPGGSTRDDEVIRACDEYGMTMVFTGVRLFHH